MAAVTALILVGSGHPNETSHDPQWIIRLWEGDSAAWTATPNGSVEPSKMVRPDSPNSILETGCRLVAEVITESGCDSVLVNALESSSIVDCLPDIRALLPEIELHLMRSV